MHLIAEGVYRLAGFPPSVLNAYLVDDVLVDAGTRFHAPFVLRALRGRRVTAHALTHVHPDHQGSSATICRTLGLPFWVSADDAAAAAAARWSTQFPHPRNPLVLVNNWLNGGPGHPVDRLLRAGDSVGSFTVVAAPGHTPGRIALWRAHDRVLIAGDALFSVRLPGGAPRLRLPPAIFTVDQEQNRASVRTLAALEPAVLCFGHGPPVRDVAALQAMMRRLLA